MVALMAVLFLGSSCTVKPRISSAADTGGAWDGEVRILFANDDSLACGDMNLFLRCNDRFHEDTLSVRITLHTPDSLRHAEDLQLVFPASESTPAALVREVVIPYRRDVQLGRCGEYTISVAPSRRVEGVESVGINLVKSNR